jgi:chromate transporter
MIYLYLFLTFLEIGAVSFGGGFGMISIIRERCLANGWLTEEEVMSFIAIAESTPGPIAVNMATFVGSSQGGILGSLVATLGIVLPSFIIILAVAALLREFFKYKAVNATLSGIRPAVIGMILATGITMLLKVLFSFSSYTDAISPNPLSILLIALVFILDFIYARQRKKQISPIFLILFSALFGILFL